MTGLNGLELLNKVKELNPKVRTMLITAYDIANNPAFENYLKQGIIDSFTEKPIKVNRLRQMVSDEIQAYRQTEISKLTLPLNLINHLQVYLVLRV